MNWDDIIDHAEALHGEGDSEEAISLLREVLQEGSAPLRASGTLANVLSDVGCFDDAERVLLELSRTHPDNVVVAINRAILYRRMCRREDAVSEASRALKSGPQDAGAIAVYADTVEWANLPDTDQKLREMVADLYGQSEVLGEIGRLAAKLGFSSIAKAALEECVHMNPCHVSAWNDLGGVLINTGEYFQAKIALEQALKWDTKRYLVYANMGCLAERQGQVQDARNAYEEACKLKPIYGPAVAGLARTSREK